MVSDSLRYDAVVVGGGHNGLVCAAYLARAGMKTVVLERRHLVGGAAVTEEVWPGLQGLDRLLRGQFDVRRRRAGPGSPEIRLPRLSARPGLLRPLPGRLGLLALGRPCAGCGGDREDQRQRWQGVPGVQPRARRARGSRSAPALQEATRPGRPVASRRTRGALARALRLREPQEHLAARRPDDDELRRLSRPLLRGRADKGRARPRGRHRHVGRPDEPRLRLRAPAPQDGRDRRRDRRLGLRARRDGGRLRGDSRLGPGRRGGDPHRRRGRRHRSQRRPGYRHHPGRRHRHRGGVGRLRRPPPDDAPLATRC